MKEKLYTYTDYPENIRQIGQPAGDKRIYIEDYVMTYMRRVFEEGKDHQIVILIGKEGKQEAANGVFAYGAIKLELPEDSWEIQPSEWEEMHEALETFFPKAHILGFGCGVAIWNSMIDQRVRNLQEKQLVLQSQFLFLADLSEKEEKVFYYAEHSFIEQTGYYIYYEHNPQMQDYMLQNQQQKSIEINYHDDVTQQIRQTINHRKINQEWVNYATCAAGCLLFVLILLGGNMLRESMEKIETMETSIARIAQYIHESNRSADAEDTKMVFSDAFQEAKTITQSGAKANVTSKANDQSKENTTSKTNAKSKENTTSNKNDNSKENTVSKANSQAKTSDKTTATTDNLSQNQKEKVTQQERKTSPLPQSKKKKKGRSYIVQKGDTLSQIVWRYYHSYENLDEIARMNGIQDSDKIYVGQSILLPNS